MDALFHGPAPGKKIPGRQPPAPVSPISAHKNRSRQRAISRSAEFTLGQGQHRSFVLTHVRRARAPAATNQCPKGASTKQKDSGDEWCSSNTYERTVAGCRRAIAHYAQSSHLSAYGRNCRCSHDIVARVFRPRIETGTIATAGCETQPSPSNPYSRLAITRRLEPGKNGFFRPLVAMCEACRSCMGCGANDISRNASFHGCKDIEGRSRSGWEMLHRNRCKLDVYGEVADAIVSMKRAGLHLDKRLLRLQRELTDYVASICHLPASGLWEQRNQKKHYTYSKAMAWLALHHGSESTKGRKALEWKAIRDRLHRQICRRGFNRKLGSFVQSFDSNVLDASVLLLPIFGFLPFNDDRVRGTMDVIQKKLSKDGFIYRLSPNSTQGSRIGLYRLFVLDGSESCGSRAPE